MYYGIVQVVNRRALWTFVGGGGGGGRMKEGN